jgi:uncharacterized membrane protein
VKLSRLLKHVFVPDWIALRALPGTSLKKIEQAIKASEQKHAGEIRFVVEGAMPLPYLIGSRSSRRRAEDLFSTLKVWDTEGNTGVLIYVQLLSHHIDIVADRGIAAKVDQSEWNAVCRAMERAFQAERFLEGSLEAIERVTALLTRHFPSAGGGGNELPDRPVVL